MGVQMESLAILPRSWDRGNWYRRPPQGIFKINLEGCRIPRGHMCPNIPKQTQTPITSIRNDGPTTQSEINCCGKVRSVFLIMDVRGVLEKKLDLFFLFV